MDSLFENLQETLLLNLSGLKGHSSVKENEKCDKLAVSAHLSENLSIDGVLVRKKREKNRLF